MSPQYQRPGANQVPIAVNDVVLITTPDGTNHPAGCGCGSCGGGGGTTGTQGTQGVRGAQGLQGVQGTQGLLGTGTQGVQGRLGTQGVQGVQGTKGDPGTIQSIATYVAYEHTQGAASASWTINHNLGFKPNVTVVDSAGNIVEGEITYTNSNSLTVSFQSAFSGYAYLS
jgi:hypothetical protein